MLFTESVTLWADNRWRDPSPRGQRVRHREPNCVRTRQLPTHHWCITRTSHGMSGPWENRTLRLSAHNEGWNQTSQGLYYCVGVDYPLVLIENVPRPGNSLKENCMASLSSKIWNMPYSVKYTHDDTLHHHFIDFDIPRTHSKMNIEKITPVPHISFLTTPFSTWTFG